MSGNFWQRAFNVQQPQAPAQQPHWNTPPAAPAASQPHAVPPGYQNPQGLAVAPARGAQDQEVAIRIANQGYLKRPPGWVRSQPTDRCPNCEGVNFVYSGDTEGSAGQMRMTKHGPVRFGHCFDCGYRENGGHPLSDAQVGNFGSKGLGAGSTVATRQGQQRLKNFYEIKIT